jgi:hypothetical protein
MIVLELQVNGNLFATYGIYPLGSKKGDADIPKLMLEKKHVRARSPRPKRKVKKK